MPSSHRATALAAGVLVADQATKTVAQHWNDGTVITPVENADYALGLISGPWPLLCLGMGIAVVIAQQAQRRSEVLRAWWWIVPAFAAGAVSNLADRLVIGAVRDFATTPWFVFNVADVAIGASLVGCYVAMTLNRRRARRVAPLRCEQAP